MQPSSGGGPGRPPSLMAYPSYVLAQVHKAAHRALADALAEHDIGPGHFAVLAAVDDLGALTQQQLARCLDIDKSHMVGAIDHLEHLGLVVRQRDAQDRRCHRIALTPGGRAVLAQAHEADRRCQDRVFGCLTAVERRRLAVLLGRTLSGQDGHGHQRLGTRA